MTNAVAIAATFAVNTATAPVNSATLREVDDARRSMNDAGEMAPEPDYEAVLLEEFEAALAAGTRTALIRFIARHPEHRLADRARVLLGEGSGFGAEGGSDDPDAAVYRAFDEALRAGEKGLVDFIRAHPRHPLADEARRRMTGNGGGDGK